MISLNRRTGAMALLLLPTLLLSACGKARPGSNEASSAAPATRADAFWKHESVASKLGEYSTVIELGRDGAALDEAWWQQFRQGFVRAIASDATLKDDQLGSLAFEDVGREPDAFRRDDKLKTHAGGLASLRKEATSKLQIDWGFKPNRGMEAIVGPYDMNSESYKIQVLNLDGLTEGYDFQHRAAQQRPVESLMFVFKAPGSYEFNKKVPKEQARAIEAKLAPIRGPDATHPADIPVSAFVTVAQTEAPVTWTRASMNVWVDAVALHLPGSSPKDVLLLLDGPDFAPTYKR